MKNFIGMEPLKKAVLETFEEKNYLLPGVLGNFILDVPEENGRTSVLKALSNFLFENKMREFSAQKHFLEYKIDDYCFSVPKIQDIFGEIEANSGFANQFCGVVGFGTDFLAKRLFEKPTEFFFEKAEELSKYSTLVFFVPNNGSISTQKLCEKLIKIEGTNLIEIPPYSPMELAKIALGCLYENFVVPDNPLVFEKEIENIFSLSEETSAKEAAAFGRKLLSFAEFNENANFVYAKEIFGAEPESEV